jgi:hypothetical protein
MRPRKAIRKCGPVSIAMRADGTRAPGRNAVGRCGGVLGAGRGGIDALYAAGLEFNETRESRIAREAGRSNRSFAAIVSGMVSSLLHNAARSQISGHRLSAY